MILQSFGTCAMQPTFFYMKLEQQYNFNFKDLTIIIPYFVHNIV
jgi:hypothetical protein